MKQLLLHGAKLNTLSRYRGKEIKGALSAWNTVRLEELSGTLSFLSTILVKM
jgi:hypothetical protein